MKILSLLLLLTSFQAYSGITVVSPWVRPLRTPLKFGPSPHERTRPIVLGDILYTAANSGKVCALHRIENYVLWEKDLDAGVDGAFSYGRSRLMVGDTQGTMWALNARDGSEAWRFKTLADWIAPPLILRDKVFAPAANDELYVLSEKDGMELTHFSHRGEEKITILGQASPVTFGGDLYQGFSDSSLFALSASQVKTIWSKKLKTKSRFYDIDGTPYVDDKSIIVSTFDGNLYQLNRLNGNVQWSFPVGSYGGFLVEGDRLYFSGNNGSVYALDKNTGNVIWRTVLEKGIGLTPARTGDYLVVSTSSDPVYLLNPKDGIVVWRGYLGAGTLAAATGTPDGWFYVLSNFGNLYAFRIYSTDPSLLYWGLPIGIPSALVKG